MKQAPRYTELRDYLRVLREQRWLVLAIVIVIPAATLVMSMRQPEVYEAGASLEFRSENEDFGALGGGIAVGETGEQRSAVAAEAIVSTEVAKRAARKLKGDITAKTLLDMVTVDPEARTNFVVVRASAGSPELAADVANVYAIAARDIATQRTREYYRERADALRRQTRKLPNNTAGTYTRTANLDRINKLESLAAFAEPAVLAVQAVPDDRPVSPLIVRNTMLAFLVALTLAVVLAFMRDSLDRRFKSSHEVTETLRLPLMGHVRNDVLGRTAIASNGRPALSGEELEGFRILRTNVDFLDVDKPVKTLLVTSALPEEGKSTVAVGLACTYAAAGRRVLLVECDLRRPTLAKRFGIDPAPGLSDYLAGNAGPQEVLRAVDHATLQGAPDASGHTIACITAGTSTPRPAELLGSARFTSFLEQVSGVYDTVILDTSPLLSVSDTLELVPRVDGVLLCVRTSKTTRNQITAAKAALEHFPPRPTGVVLTGLKAGSDADYGYYSYAYADSSKN